MSANCSQCEWCWKFVDGRGYAQDKVGCDCKQREDAKSQDFIVRPLRCIYFKKKQK